MLFFHNILSMDINPVTRQGVQTACSLLESVNERRIRSKIDRSLSRPPFFVMVIVAGLRHGLFPGNTCTSSSVFRSAHQSGKTERKTESTVHAYSTVDVPSMYSTIHPRLFIHTFYSIRSLLYGYYVSSPKKPIINDTNNHILTFFSWPIHRPVSSASQHASTASQFRPRISTIVTNNYLLLTQDAVTDVPQTR